MGFKKVLIAVDSSPCSLHAVKKGVALARALNAAVALIFVIDRSHEIVSSDLGITPLQSESILLQQAEETVNQMIKMYSQDNNMEIGKFLPEGFPKDEILATAKQWKADLIVMGTHGRTGLAHFLMGSIAEYVVRHASIPVMVVPQHE
ncbi:universal stress protein [Arachidicoccus sp.]|jgi:nucleotide-binding universal stress UspA family protein|uniref:universal stress protein n=1 Tax=Arachidicoccus sp. TaxID=1872624 RepID=UPI003D1EB83D